MRVVNKRWSFATRPYTYIGRGRGQTHMMTPGIKPGEDGWLGNPVVIGKRCTLCGDEHTDSGSTLSCYSIMLSTKMDDPEFLTALKSVAKSGLDLMCWCAPRPCHGSVLLETFQSWKSSPQQPSVCECKCGGDIIDQGPTGGVCFDCGTWHPAQ